MSSRALGEDTEAARNSLGEIDLDEDFIAAFEGKICDENQELLERSAIAIASSSLSSYIIMENICSEGVNCLKIKAMGGMMHLIIFDTFEDKKAIMESKWMDRWFMAIRNVNDQSASLWRETWIKIHGMPLIAWGYDNFYKIGCIFGRVLSVNYTEYDCAHVLIFTDSFSELNGKMSMSIGDKKYPVFVSEVKISKIPHNSDMPPPATPTSKNTKFSSVPEKLHNHSENDEPLGNNLTIGLPTSPSQQPQYSNPQEKPFTTPNGKCQPQLTNQGSFKRGNTCHSPLPRSPNLSNVPKKITITSPKVKALMPSPPKPTAQENDIPSAQPKIVKPIQSPIKTHNKFDPLSRQSSKTISSSGTNGSSSCSGPIFPPGFEDKIPPHVKTAQEEKRRKKLEKKRKLRSIAASNKDNHMDYQFNLNAGGINADDIIEMADILGLSFNGPTSELRARIDLILHGQKQVWDGQHQ